MRPKDTLGLCFIEPLGSPRLSVILEYRDRLGTLNFLAWWYAKDESHCGQDVQEEIRKHEQVFVAHDTRFVKTFLVLKCFKSMMRSLCATAVNYAYIGNYV